MRQSPLISGLTGPTPVPAARVDWRVFHHRTRFTAPWLGWCAVGPGPVEHRSGQRWRLCSTSRRDESWYRHVDRRQSCWRLKSALNMQQWKWNDMVCMEHLIKASYTLATKSTVQSILSPVYTDYGFGDRVANSW